MSMHYTHVLRSVATGLVFAAASVSLHAEMIVGYDIGTLVDTSDTDVAGVAPNAGITAGDLTVVGLTRNLGGSQDDHFVFKDWKNADQGAASQAYFTFSIRVANGTKLDLTNLVYTARASNGGPREMGLYWSVDNYAVPLGRFSIGGNSNLSVDMDLSATETVLGSGQTIEFRLIKIGTERADGTEGIRGHGTAWIRDEEDGPDFILSGSVRHTARIPEPGSYALLAGCLALTSVIVRRRR